MQLATPCSNEERAKKIREIALKTCTADGAFSAPAHEIMKAVFGDPDAAPDLSRLRNEVRMWQQNVVAYPDSQSAITAHVRAITKLRLAMRDAEAFVRDILGKMVADNAIGHAPGPIPSEAVYFKSI